MHRDDRADVARVALAEVGIDLLVDRVELAAQLLELLGGQVGERALWSLTGHRCVLPVGLCGRNLDVGR